MDQNGLAVKTVIDRIRHSNKSFYSSDQGRGALKDLQQTFPYPWLYVGELLQNAVDAGAKSIRLAIEPNSCSLIFEHDGAAFSERNVVELSSRGISTKGSGTVGFMGIGFKAVFQSFECADISSGPWRFRFCVPEEFGDFDDRQRDWLGCVLPEYVPEIADPSPRMCCRIVLHHRIDGLGPIHEDVTNVLSADLIVLALLARRGVKELEWYGRRWLLSQSEERLDEHQIRVLVNALEEATGCVLQWILFNANYQPSRKAIARFLEHRQIRPDPKYKQQVYLDASRKRSVEVFCQLNEAGFPMPPPRGQAYALLATGVTIPIGLHVQADWLLNTSRRELMDVNTNAWHQEILDQLAGLVRAYLCWVTHLTSISERVLTAAYAVLPSWSGTEGVFEIYFQNPQFRHALRDALTSLAFLPVRTEHGIHFVTANEGRLLPHLLRAFDDTRMLPWTLFGGDIISTVVLGGRTLDSLEHLQLLQSMTPADLVSRWRTTGIGPWLDELSDEAAKGHIKLLQALASLDNIPAWREAPLCCLPTASGTWIDRNAVVGLPANWDSIPVENPPLRTWLEPFIPKSETCLEWGFDRSIQRDPGAQMYLARLQRRKFEDLLSAWWVGLPAVADEETRTKVLETTCWVMMKQRQQSALILRILCENKNGELILARLSDAVLSDPYASRARRHFFPNYPIVSQLYLHHKPGYSDADWRSFFEDADKTMKGPFRPAEEVRECTPQELRQFLPQCELPQTKAGRITARWGDRRFSSDKYLLVNTDLPKELRAVLAQEINRSDAQAMAQWLTEGRQELRTKARYQVVYVPFFQSRAAQTSTQYLAKWVVLLRKERWLYAADGTGPYSPDQVLPTFDPARPDAPVVHIAEELVTTLESCGVRFGGSLPDVASIERLKREGPTAGIGRVLHLLEQAVKDASATGHLSDLEEVLKSCAMVVVPPSVILVDGALRVTVSRLVQRGARGGALGGWLVPIDTAKEGLDTGDDHVRLLDSIASAYDVPIAPTWEQTLSFLRWVWESRPDAEQVRRILPRAYRAIADGLDSTNQSVWDEARAHSVVYVASRKWALANSNDLFLDDLGDDRLKGLVRGLALATPGHLGETPDEQRIIAGLLGVRLLSHRFQVELDFDGEQTLEPQWIKSFLSLFDLIQSYAREDQETETLLVPSMVYCARIIKSLSENGFPKAVWDVYAARDGDRILIAGAPDDFAADLCRVLLQWAGLAGRRDLDELAPSLTQLIGWIGQPQKFSQRMAVVRKQEPSDTPPSPPSKVSTPEAEPVGTPAATGSAAGVSDGAATPPAPETARASTSNIPVVTGSQKHEKPEESGNDNDSQPPSSSGYTSDHRENRLRALRKRLEDTNTQIQALLGVGVVPSDDIATKEGDEPGKSFRSDTVYRQAAQNFETVAGRFPEPQGDNQPGYDLASFDRPPGDPERKLIRLIEVKGRGYPWEDEETVELSDRQFFDAAARRSDEVLTAKEFDYWLYVVERRVNGELFVLPIRNPAKRAKKFELRGGTWRALAEQTALRRE